MFYWFETRVALPALVYQAKTEQLRELETYFAEHGRALADLMTQSCRVSYSSLESLYSTVEVDGIKIARELVTSRLGRQRGGLCFPVIWHKCFVPASLQMRPSRWELEMFAVPGLIAIKDIVAVQDFCHARGLETFYFRHGSSQVTEVDREYLWPSPSDDSLLAWVERVTRDVAADYLTDVCPDLYDPDRGLIDRGYRP